MSPLRGERLLKRPIASLSESCSREWAALALNQCAVAMESVAELGLVPVVRRSESLGSRDLHFRRFQAGYQSGSSIS